METITAEPYDTGKNYHRIRISNQILDNLVRLSLHGNRMLVFVLYMLSETAFRKQGKTEAHEDILLSIPLSDFQRAAGTEKGHCLEYRRVRKAAAELESLFVPVVYGKKTGCVQVFKKANIKNGTLNVLANRDAFFIVHPKKNYTTVTVEQMMAFTNSHAILLYMYIRSKAYNTAWEKKDKTSGFSLNIRTEELRFILGTSRFCNSFMEQMKNGDIEYFNYAKEYRRSVLENLSRYTSFSQFHRSVLKKAVSEINAISDLTITYGLVFHGTGGKTESVDFRFHLNHEHPACEKAAVSAAEECVRLMPDMRVYFNMEEITRFCIAADADSRKVIDKYEIFCRNAGHVYRPAGYMIAAIEGDWQCRKNLKTVRPKHYLDVFFTSIKAVLYQAGIIHSDDFVQQLTDSARKSGLSLRETERRMKKILKETKNGGVSSVHGYLAWALNQSRNIFVQE